MKRIYLSLVTTVALGFMFSGCGSSDSTSTPSGTTGTLVDPYISGAILCQDTNGNGVCDAGEPVSTATTSTGAFTFTDVLTAGKNVIIKTQGTHEGMTFDLNISGVVANDGTISVVSPLTTFASKSLSASQLVEILTKAASDAGVSASYSFDQTTIFNNPLSGDLMNTSVNSITEAQLTNIRASLAAYGILKIMEGSSTLKALSGTELYTSGTTTGSPVNLIAQEMMKSLANALNTTLLTTIKTAVDGGRTALESGLATGLAGTSLEGTATAKANEAMPDVKVGIVVKVATKIINDIATTGYTACNNTTGTDAQKVNAGLTAAGTRASTITSSTAIMNLGTTLWAFDNKLVMTNALSGYYAAGLTGIKAANADIARALNATSSVTTFKFATDGSVEAYSN